MRTRLFVVVLAWLSLVPWTGSARTAPVSGLDAIPFELGEYGALTVTATINSVGPIRLLIDTGANRSVISVTLAEKLRAPVVARSEMVTSAASALTNVVRLDRLTIGATDRVDVLALAVPASVLARAATNVDGIVGQDVLLDLNYTLDYRHHLLTWNEPSPVRDDLPSRLKLFVSEGRYIVELPQNHDNCAALKLVPDSGASDIVLYQPFDTALRLRPTSAIAGIDWLVGHRDARLMRLPELRVGRLALYDQPVVVIDRPASAAGADGVLPLRLFSAVSFSGRDALLAVK